MLALWLNGVRPIASMLLYNTKENILRKEEKRGETSSRKKTYDSTEPLEQRTVL